MKKGIVATICGLIGVGKSTLVNNLNCINNYTIFMEPTSESEGASDNPFLEDYYKDPHRWALAMQVNLLWERFKQQQEAYYRSLHGEICLLDSSIYSDMAFALVQKRDGYFTDKEYKCYQNMADNVTAICPRPDVLIYLDITPEQVMERIKKRSRECESSIPMEYLQHLHEAYKEVLESLSSKCRVEHVDATQGKVDVMMDVDRIIKILSK